MTGLNIVALIPARFGSSRFPGKPLSKLNGKEIILHVCTQVNKSGILPIVATDDDRIFKCVESAGFKTVMTSDKHCSGTDRIREALDKINNDNIDVVINVQGDEPFIRPEQLLALASKFTDESVSIATLIKKFNPEEGINALLNPNLVKVVKDNSDNALYFSRSIIPFVRGIPVEEWLAINVFYTHIGVYAYQPAMLRHITSLPQGNLEKAESLEQLRWLEAGIPIKTVLTEGHGIGIDTPQDLEEAEKIAQQLG